MSDKSRWVVRPGLAELLQFEMPRIVTPAEGIYKLLVRQIIEFEHGLTPDEEIGGRLVTAPNEGAFHIEDLSYSLPHMIIYHGKNEHGRPLRLVQHHSQLSVLLTALPKKRDEPRRIGFILHQRGVEGK
jgi:hypothetical protein